MQVRKRWVSETLVGKTEKKQDTFQHNTNLKNNIEVKLKKWNVTKLAGSL